MGTATTKQTHTPGPWKIYESKHPDTGYGRRVEVFPVAVDICGGSPEECDANARIIAAAPDMFAALKRLLAHECWSVPSEQMDRQERVDLLEAAIAKAESR